MKRRAPWNIARLFVLLVLAVAMVSMMGTVAFAQEADNSADKECYLKGDMNADGKFGTDDAIYELYHTFYPDDYPFKQNGDFTGDDKIGTQDAIELLYATFGLWEEYDSFGKVVHDYYDPAWSWEETADGVAATVTVQCACGDKSHSLEADVVEGETVTATCTAAGSRVYTATVSDDDEIFTSTYTQVIAAAGHVAGEAAYDDNQHYTLCANCGEKLNAASHSWVADGEATAATCKVAAVQNYKCSCGATKSEELGFAEHAYQYVGDVLVDGETCRYAKKNQCADCGDVKLTDEYDNHDYVASVKEATCQADGEKVYKCSLCGVVDEGRTETIAKGEDKHIWNDGVENAGVITYTCTVDGCGATKTAVTTSEDGTVSKDALQNADQLEVGDATLEMDEAVKDGLDADKEIQITVESMDVADAEAKLESALTDEQKAQIGDNKVYDFNMSYSDGQKVNFDGWITVSLPYTLAEGEDIDAIDVWYIADDGTLVQQEATYSNGYVTFKTNHFSYYTVTRLTPAERCERYGHIWTDANKAATCTADGYTKKVCQRCTAEADLVVIGKTGHNYKTTTTAATCEKFGSVVETCANCGHTKSTVTPALGHNMQLSETVNATCDAAGKKVYTCANGCGHSTEEAIPQLTHSYKKDETKTVVATCTTGGYDIHVCEHCGNEIKKNETTPTGHHYGTDNAVWNWNADDTEATLVLTCDHECGSTKELAATVNVVKATCLGNGSVKAAVFYNNKSYTDEKAGASATGHKPASEWSTTEDVHYYKCEACGTKLEEATHDMDNGVVTKEPTCTGDGLKVYTCAVCGYTEEEILKATGKHAYDDGKVTKEPTCTEAGLVVYTCAVCGETKEEVIDASGKHSYNGGVVTKEPTCKEKGTKVYTCTVCGFTREEAIAATGDHTYVNGVCSVCGKAESACNHYKTTATRIDISAFDICDGMEIYEISCECGKNRTLEIPKFACEMITITEGYNEDGTSAIYIEECKNCGLRAESGSYIENAPDACRAQYVEWGKLIMDGVTVAEFSIVREESEEHPVYIPGEEIVLTDKGMCDLTIVTYSCPCGEKTQSAVEVSCSWMQTGENSLVCKVCGATYSWKNQEPVVDGCQVTVNRPVTYTNQAGEVVYEYNDTYTYTEHYDQVTDYELFGDSCADGIWVEYTCTECGEVHDEYNEGDYHPMVESTITDLEDAKICASAHIQDSCACGREKHSRLHYTVEGGICQWAWVAPPDGNQNSDIDYYQCSVCGAVMTNVITRAEKNENCEATYSETRTYRDADGNVLAEGVFKQTGINHNIQFEYELKGESCEDGVIVTEYCADCGMSNSWEIDHHAVDQFYYDLSEFGFCGGYVRFYSCPCGQEAWSEIGSWGCEWMGMGDEGWTYHECRNCGGVWETWYEEVVIDACHSQMDYTHSFRMGDKEVLNIAYVEKIDNHRWVHELTLWGETCNDGFTVKKTCLTCGETDEYGEEHIGHQLWAINREMISEGQLCGDVEKVTLSCACGLETYTEYRWHNGECNFMFTGWGEEDDSYIYTCSKCGAVRYERNFHEQVPGGTVCQWQHRWEYTYSLKDEVLFVETGVGYGYNHRWDYEYTLLGETCEDGVIVKETCAKCGEQTGERTIYHHEIFGKEYDLSELGLCGGYARIESCACGQDTWAEIEPWGCDWLTDVDKEGHVKNTCRSCGAVWEVRYEDVQIDDCNGKTNFIHSFQKDGKEVLNLEWTENYTSHNYEETFELLGKTCIDGVIVIRTCTKCGYSDRYETYRHEEFILEEYDLAEYGFCEGYLRVFGCACGESQNASWDSNCTWYGVGGFGPGETSFSETCGNCGMVFTMTWNDGEELDSCHTKVDRTVSFAKGDVAIRAAYHEIWTHHRAVHSLSFWEGSSSCQEGFYVTEHCLDCGNEFGSWGTGGDHPTYIVDRQFITLDAEICGTVERLIYSCACGENIHEEYLFDGCQFQEIYDEKRGEWIFACAGCGVERMYEYTEVPVEGEPCKAEFVRTYTYLKNGVALLSYTTKEVGYSHNQVAVYTLLVEGGTCDDGYTITWVCQDCGEVTGNSGTNYGCVRRLMRRDLVVPEGVLCGALYLDTYSCACGKESSTQTHWEGASCSFWWDVDKQADVCANCGVERYSTTDRKYIEGTICEYQCTEVVTFLRGGKELYTYTRTYKTISHNNIAQFNLQVPGGTCDDGYTITWVCADCGTVLDVQADVRYGCQTYRISEELLASKGVLCGDLYRYTNRCACGKVTETGRYWSNGSCSFRQTGYDEVEQCYIYVCDNCGAYRRDYSENTQVDRCHQQHTWTDIYYDANGNQLFTESGSNVYHSPNWIYTYQLNGKTCDEGYTRFGKCAYCDETYEDAMVYYGCSTNRVEVVEIVPDSDKVCGPIELSVYSCACGKNSHWGMSHKCSFGWIGSDADTGKAIYQCYDCGVTYTENDTTLRQPGNCLVTETIDRVYTVTDGETAVEVGSINKTITYREHQTVSTYTMVDGATSCEDGYYWSQHCIYCDYTWSSDGIRYDHNYSRIAYYDLADYGKCGGYVEGHSCACGKNESWSWWDGGCNYIWTGEKNEYGVSERYCETCNTYFYMDDVGEYVPEECHNQYTLYARLIRDGKVLLDLVQEYEQESHTLIMVGYDGSCEEQITVYQQCYFCDEQWQSTVSNHSHNTYKMDILYLKDITCNGYVSHFGCPCGKYIDVGWSLECSWNYGDWMEDLVDGVYYYSRTRTCEICGLTIKETYHDEEADENCRYNRIRTYEFSLNGEVLKIYQAIEHNESHNYEMTNVELLGASCEDGVNFTYTCKCGASYTNGYTYHAKYQHEDKTIDLSQYGSVCGCELEFHGCACGAEQSYNVSNQNCDVDTRYIPVWVEGALNEGQETTEGWRSAYSYAYTYTCAVTDPQCGLKIRMGNIWLKEGDCTAVQYQIWQLGYKETYDETTGETTYSWEKEIMIPTGSTVTFHDYAYTSGTNYLDDGTQVNYQDYLCSDCGSSWHVEDHYLNGNYTYSENTATNTLANGERKLCRTVVEYGFRHNGSTYETLRTESYIYADGTETWWKRETSYTSADACKYVCTETNSDGYSNTWESEHYFTTYNWSWIDEPTCSQPGVEQRTEICQLCNEVVDIQLYDTNPYKHSWYWDYEMGHYFCSRCGLENSNGADGTIVVEDLTGGYGNNTDYVVGYWNQGNGEFTIYASVILDDVTDGNDEIVLTGIDFTYLTVEKDGICAISTSQSVIQGAAKAAIADAGYTGSYAIRIAFVPADSAGTLDYAITFDSQTA